MAPATFIRQFTEVMGVDLPFTLSQKTHRGMVDVLRKQCLEHPNPYKVVLQKMLVYGEVTMEVEDGNG
jgi:hypothetical protein